MRQLGLRQLALILLCAVAELTCLSTLQASMAIFSTDGPEVTQGRDESVKFLLTVSRNEKKMSTSELFYAPNAELLDVEDYWLEFSDGFRSSEILQVSYVSNLRLLSSGSSQPGFRLRDGEITLTDFALALSEHSDYHHLLLTNTQDRSLFEGLAGLSTPGNLTILVSYGATEAADFISPAASQFYKALVLPDGATYLEIPADRFIEIMASSQTNGTDDIRFFKGWRTSDTTITGFPLSAAVTNVALLEEERLAEERRLAEARLAEEERLAEERRLAEARSAEEERLAEELATATKVPEAQNQGGDTNPAVAMGVPDEVIGTPSLGQADDMEPSPPSDRSLVLVTKLDPKYPYFARKRGIEGTCQLQFTVTKTGDVADVRALDCKERVLRKESIRTIKKYEYLPRIVDGVAIDTPDVTETFRFYLPKGMYQRGQY